MRFGISRTAAQKSNDAVCEGKLIK